LNGIIELIIAIIIIIFMVLGVKRGLIRQILAIVGIVAAFIGSFYLAHNLAGYLETKTDLPYRAALIVSALILFIGILILFHLLGLALQKIINITVLRSVDRTGGGILGFLKGVLLVSMILVIILNLPFPEDFKKTLREDPVASVIRPVLPGLFNLVLKNSPADLDFRSVLRSGDDEALEKVKKKAEEVKEGLKKGKERMDEAVERRDQ